MTSLVRQLMDIGLTNMQSRMYVSLLQLGQATATEASKHSGINRVTAYVTLAELEEKKLVEADEYDQVKQFRLTSLESLEVLFIGRAKKAIKSYRQVQALIPDLQKAANTLIHAPRTHYEEGQQACEAYLDNVPTSAVLEAAYIAGDTHYEVLKPLIKRAADADVRPRVLIPASVKANLVVYLDHRVIPGKNVQFPTTTLLLSDRVLLMLESDQLPQIFAVVDKRIAKQYLHMFDITWRIVSGTRIIVPQLG